MSRRVRIRPVLVLLLATLLLLTSALTVSCGREQGMTKEQIFALVLHDGNRADFMTNVREVIESDGKKYKCYTDEIEGIYLCDFGPGVTCVDFSLGSLDSAGKSQQGFYYIKSDKPTGWLGESMEGCESGDGWEIESAGGIFYTERITRNWFYYRIDF